MNPADLGTARLTPDDPVVVSTCGSWTLEYTAGKYGLDDGGGLIVVQRPMADAVPLQTEDPAAPAYLSAETDADAQLRVSFQKRYWIRPCKDAVVVGVFDGSVAPGQKVRVSLGDTRGGSAGWTLQTFPESAHRFHVLVDAFGTREYYPLAESPCLRIEPGEPARLDAVLPSYARPDEDVPLRFRVMDRWYNPLDEFRGELEVQTPAGVRRFELAGGSGEAGALRFAEEGVYRLELRCGDLRGVSNPVCVRADVPTVFWADMHGQTEQTVGTGSVEEYFRFARDKGLLDATSWQGNDFQVTDALWQEVCRQTERFNEPGRFTTFLGYEWSGLTPCGGDHNIYFLNDHQQIHRSSHWQIHDGSDESTDRYPVSELWREFDGREDVMAIAHVGGRHGNLEFWDDRICRLVEVHSHHGTFEWLLHEAIERGLIFGVAGQSDDHSGRPGLSAPLRALPRDFATFDVFGGLTGIYADRCDRESLWQALRQRRCWATTGERILLELSCGTAIMGDVLDRNAAGAALELSAAVVGTAGLLEVELYRNSEPIARLAPPESDGNWIRVEWSGVRIRSRSKIADWPIEIQSVGGRILEVRPYGFRQSDEYARLADDRTVQVSSRTSGDLRGVFCRVDEATDSLQFRSPHLEETIALDSLHAQPREIPAGGINLAVRCSRQGPDGRPLNARLEHVDAVPGAPAAYWLRAVQIDGHMAWSSPIFVR
jgi:hypothetical protein